MRPSSCRGLPWLALGLALGPVLGSGLACSEPGSRSVRTSAVRRSEKVEPAADAAGPDADDQAVPAATHSPPSRPALSADQRQRFEAAVAEGRRLHGARDYEGAIEAYVRALDLLPGDARTLSELGWATLFTGRLDEAEAVLRRAEAGVGDDSSLQAAILYNLGRVAEARGDTAGAVEAYQQSLQLRPHPAAYRHLSGLEGGTRYAFGPRVRRLQGPYERLADFCQEEERLSADQRDASDAGDEAGDEAGAESGAEAEAFACLPDAARGLGGTAVEVPRVRSLSAPWLGLRFVEVRPSPYAVRFHAALRTEGGWYVVPDVAALTRGTPGTTERVTRLVARVEPLFRGGAPEVVLEVETRWTATEGSRELESETHRVEFLCGLGPSRRPSCTGALPRATRARRREAGGVEQTRWTIERRVLPEGVVVLEGDPDALDEPAAAVLGAHAVEFP